MHDLARWLCSATLEPAQDVGLLSIHPLTSEQWPPFWLLPWEQDDRGGTPAEWVPGCDQVPVANLSKRTRLILQGDVLKVTGVTVEATAPRLVMPRSEGTMVPCRTVAVRGNAATLSRAARMLDAINLPVFGTIGYLALLGSRFVRLELFPNYWFCRDRWDWALGSVAGLLALLDDPSAMATTPGADLDEIAAVVEAGAWESEAPGVLKLATGRGPRGHAVRLMGEPVYLDLSARIRAGGVALAAWASPPTLEAAEELELPQPRVRVAG